MGQPSSAAPVARRRVSPAACRAGSSGSDRLTSFVLNITLLRILSVAGSPLRQIVSWYIFTGRSCWALVVDLQRWLWRAVGWLSAPPRSAALQRFGRPLLDVRRWHYGFGEHSRPLRPLTLLTLHCFERQASVPARGQVLEAVRCSEAEAPVVLSEVPCQHGCPRSLFTE